MTSTNTVTLITGGCRSGKSSRALALASSYKHPLFLATAEAADEEMRERIAKHRQERPQTFTTVEESINPASVFAALASETDLILMDCVTVWLSNLIHHYGEKANECPEIEALFDALDAPVCDVILVTNEAGSGIVPMNPVARQFRDLAGFINQSLASHAHVVEMTVCGIPLTLKGEIRGNPGCGNSASDG